MGIQLNFFTQLWIHFLFAKFRLPSMNTAVLFASGLVSTEELKQALVH
jgi:hypothetical protein